MKRSHRLPRDHWITLGLVFYGLLIVAWVLVNDVRVTREDGFYYFKIAQHIGTGSGSTFDGLHVTNGYHPLWLLCLVPVFWVSPGPEAGLKLGIGLQGIFMALSAGLLYRIARLGTGRLAAGLAALVWIALTHREALSGLEFSVHALTLLATAQAYVRCVARESPAQGVRPYLGLGLLMGLAFLARLENLTLAVFISLTLARRESRGGFGREGLRRMLALGLPVAAASVAYVAVNLWLCGQPLPVSGAVKREWSAFLLSQDPHFQVQGFWGAKLHQLLWPLRNARQVYPFCLSVGSFGVAALLVVAELEASWKGRLVDWAAALRPFLPFAAFSVLQLLAYALLYHGELSFIGSPWYYVVQPFLTALLLAVVVDRSLMRDSLVGGALSARTRWASVLVALGCCSVTLWTLWSLTRWRDHVADRVTYDSARWVSANLPPEAVVGSWHAGAVGYLSGRRVVNLDGLVNSWDYFRVGQRDLCRYWTENRIGYLVDMFEGTRAAVSGPMYEAYAPCVDRLELLWEDSGSGRGWRVAAYRIRPAKTGPD